jgi:8-oxo-dGTP diphosphatase
MKVRDIELQIVKGDITGLSVDAIVNPANTSLVMQQGLALAIKKRGGDEIEDEARAKAPLKAGEALWTNAGKLPAKYVIHAAVMSLSEPVREQHIRQACANSFCMAEGLKLHSLAIPALGCGQGGFPIVGSAKIMAQEILKLAKQKDHHLRELILCLFDDKLYETFSKTVRGYIDHIQDTLGLGPYVTVDVIIEVNGGIILIERSNPPYGWALPGGFVDCGESLEQAVMREAKEETGMELIHLRQFHTYSDPSRDPRFHTVSTVFVAQGKGTPQFGDDAKNLQVVPQQELLTREYAFDHKQVIADYLKIS